jgi:hypothetical protein
MATTPERIFVNGDAHVYIGPTNTAAPTRPTGPFTGLTEVGLFTDDSLRFSTDPNFETVTSHQSNYPTRRMQTSDEATLEVDLQEWSADSFSSAFGGGTVTETSVAGIYKYSPPALGARAERMVVVQCIDGTKNYALVIPRVMQVEGIEQDLGKGNASILPLRLAILGSGSTDPWYWITDDAAAWSGTAPTFTSITPATGPAAGGTTVNVVGTQLQNVNGVFFGKSSVALTGTPTDTSLTTGATWTASSFVGGTVTMLTGTAGNLGATRTISANTTNAIALSSALPTTPAAGDTFTIRKAATSFADVNPTLLTAVTPASVNGQVMDVILTHTASATPAAGADAYTYTA